MVLDYYSKEKEITIEDRVFRIGDKIIANKTSDYCGLTGRIFEIRTDSDKETGNDGVDIYCEFDIPEDPNVRKEIELTFSDLYGMPKTINDLGLDFVIMAPEELDIIEGPIE